jgi:hypothetical protein
MTDEEKYNLELYRDKVRELISSRFLKDENLFKFLNGEKPDEEQITFFLNKYRFFYSKKEPTHFYKICNILEKNVRNEEQKESIRSIRKIYKKILEGGTGFVFSDELKAKQSPEENIDLWFNAFYFHSDKDKREQLEKLKKEYGYIQKFVLIREIWGLVLLIKQLDEIVKEVIKQSNC